jgi:hypothetical protein
MKKKRGDTDARRLVVLYFSDLDESRNRLQFNRYMAKSEA